jgi:hypothetical protein
MMEQINEDLETDYVFESVLLINSLTQYDYGEYMCKATNQLGTSSKYIRVNHKRRPDTPSDFKIIEVTSNSVHMSWQSPEYTGENLTYVLNMNKTLNFTSTSLFTTSTNELVINAELKGLQANTDYDFKVLAFNVLGSSEFSHLIRVKTLKTNLKPENIPHIQVARFSDIREAVCFNLENNEFTNTNQFKSLKDLTVKIDLKLNNHNNNNNSTSRSIGNEIKTLLINVNKLKLGQNCISFKLLIDTDLAQQKNATLLLNQQTIGLSTTNQLKLLFAINSPARSQPVDIVGRNYYEFKHLNSINVSICYANDSNVCTEQINVIDNNSDFSNYITMVAIGCSSVFVFIILLISSLCCCCFRSKRNKTIVNKLDKKIIIINKNKMNNNVANLAIKSFPIVMPNHQKKCFDFNDDCMMKTSNQHILNGSSSSNSSSSSSSRNFYNNNNNKMNIIDQNVYDHENIQKYPYKMEYPQNTSSIATVESDVSSSISLENTNHNNNNNKSNNKTSDLTLTSTLTTHSPFAVISDTNTTTTTNNKNGFISIASSSYSNVISNMSQRQTGKSPASSTLIYSGTGNMYIKTYQPQQQQQPYFNQKSILDNNDSNNYSTPNNNLSKKLVYEVIV